MANVRSSRCLLVAASFWIALVGACVPAWTQPKADVKAKAAPPQAKAAEEVVNEKVHKMLEKELAAVEFDDMKFKDAVALFRELAGVPVYVKWNAVRAAGVAFDTRVNIKLQKITAETVLKLILSDVGAAGAKLDYIVQGGVVVISTAEDLSRVAVTKIYNVADLLLRRGNHPFWSGVVPVTEMYASGTYRGEFGGARDGGGGFFDEEDERDMDRGEETVSRASLVTDLAVVITELVAPTSWRRSGGEVGNIRVVGRQLVIHQSHSGHRAVEALLAQLRKGRADTPMISLHARWLVIDREKSQALAGGPANKRLVTEDAIKASGATVAHEGRLTFYNGQIVHLAAGNAQSLMTVVEPVVAENAAALRPVIKSVLWGALLEATAAVIEGQDRVELKIRNVVSEPTGQRTKAVPFGVVEGVVRETDEEGKVIAARPNKPRVGATELDLADFTLQTFTTNMNVPLGKPILVGGTTVTSKGPAPKVMLLVVQVNKAE